MLFDDDIKLTLEEEHVLYELERADATAQMEQTLHYIYKTMDLDRFLSILRQSFDLEHYHYIKVMHFFREIQTCQDENFDLEAAITDISDELCRRKNSQFRIGQRLSFMDMPPEILEEIVRRVSWFDVIALRSVSSPIRSTIDTFPFVYETAEIGREDLKTVLKIDGVQQSYGEEYVFARKTYQFRSILDSSAQAFAQFSRLMQQPRCLIKKFKISDFKIEDLLKYRNNYEKLDLIEALRGKREFFNKVEQIRKEKLANKDHLPLRIQCLEVEDMQGFLRLVLPSIQPKTLETLQLSGDAARSGPFQGYDELVNGLKRCELRNVRYHYSKRFRAVPDIYVACHWFGMRHGTETENSFPFTPNTKSLHVEWKAPDRSEDDDIVVYNKHGKNVRLTLGNLSAIFEVLETEID